MTDFFQTPRYQLPDDWSVTDTMCVKVIIPANPQYFGQLIGLLDTLKWSKNFAPDPTRTGAATVSRTWQRALESEPIEIEGCDMPDFRINPDTCVLEVNCSDDPESPDWKTIITDELDPRDIDYPPPYPDPPPVGQTNECLAAANIADIVWYSGAHLAERLGTGAIVTEIVVAMAGILATFFQLATSIIIDQTVILFVNITPATVDDDWLLIDKQEFVDLLVCYLNPDGSMPLANWGNFLDILLSKGITNQAWYLVYYVCALMGIGGFSLAGRIAGITDADCEICEDTWEHVFDFTNGAQGWQSAVDAHDHIASQLSGGEWVAFEITHDVLGGKYLGVHINRAIGVETTLLSIEFEGTVDRGNYIVAWNDSIWINGAIVESYDNTTEPNVVRLWEGSENATSLAILMTVSHVDSGGTITGSGSVSRVTITGTGVNPF